MKSTAHKSMLALAIGLAIAGPVAASDDNEVLIVQSSVAGVAEGNTATVA